jgi:hypothetical protein
LTVRSELAWGYVVRDIQITDMTFDKEIIDSMARVVSSKNLLAAASNEGAALPEYTDALKYVSEHSQGKVIFMDSGAAAPSRVVQGLFGMLTDAPSAPAAADASGGSA